MENKEKNVKFYNIELEKGADEMNILVIGGAGYIGSHTVNLLKKSGYNPIIYDNLSKG